jgi:hypothetical protein
MQRGRVEVSAIKEQGVEVVYLHALPQNLQQTWYLIL